MKHVEIGALHVCYIGSDARMVENHRRRKKNFYTEECPTGPWSMALSGMRLKAEMDRGLLSRLWDRVKTLFPMASAHAS